MSSLPKCLRPILLTAALLLPATAALAKMKSVRVPTANFRAAPSLKAEILFVGDRYFPVKVIEHRKDWVRIVDFEGEKAWVAYHLLSDRDTAIVQVDRGNLRAGPGLSHEVIRQVDYGEAFLIAQRKGRWLQLAKGNKVVGWVRDDLTWGD